MNRKLVIAGAGLGGLALALGAFGAHFVRTRIDPAALAWWETAVQYQMWHGLAILALGLAGGKVFRLPAGLLLAGTLVFSGTLYAMALGAPRWLGAITPMGGVLMIAGWCAIILVAARRSRN